MDTMCAFELKRPTNVAEASALLAKPNARVIAGGTDLVPNLRRGLDAPATLVDITGIAALTALDLDRAPRVIGAGVTLAHLAGDPRIGDE